MKAVVQRVSEATLMVDGSVISKINKGLVVFFGVMVGDTLNQTEYLSSKISKLRIFEDENGKMNKSVLDVGGEILCVSQFTLLGDVTHGNRPSFTDAEAPQIASNIYDYFCLKLEENGVAVKRGVFGADMKITQVNDGPVTILYEV
ncbi:MAG: D-tyrosyl-tRNA(Tyr) deacylase [Clostridia bacterium]|nr:D-tyrosyl-tRNA(Tyr) deacylase [Clostridia bacterium]